MINMVDITIKKGLVDAAGKPVNGAYISNLAPSKIIYTGFVESEIETIKKWALKVGAVFEQKSGKVKEEPKYFAKDTTELPVEDLFPE